MEMLKSAEQKHIYINLERRGSKCKITDSYAYWNVNGRKPEGLYANCRIKMHNEKRKAGVRGVGERADPSWAVAQPTTPEWRGEKGVTWRAESGPTRLDSSRVSL